ncbi:MAG: hypothetical protein PHS92_03465 [Candidatus Gracilibacteria bacterium]|nr:hypothetical protein [Candidatus Gracilibacteria bacterium]
MTNAINEVRRRFGMSEIGVADDIGFNRKEDFIGHFREGGGGFRAKLGLETIDETFDRYLANL